MVTSNSLLHYGESCSMLTYTSGCGYGDEFVVSLTGLVVGWTDEMLESRKYDQRMSENASEGI